MSDYLTPDQAAARLGVTGETVRRWIRDGRLPARRVGLARYRLRVEDVDRMVAPSQAPDAGATREEGT